jgi:hypothetical protein
MKILCVVATAVLLFCGLTASAHAASCWRVTGWSAPSGTANAIVVPTSCVTVPINFSWAPVVYGNGTPPPEDLWLLFDLNDSRIEGRFLQFVLIFDHFDTTGKPVVNATIFVGPNPNTTQLLPYPPVQGAIPYAPSAIVRLRHVNSGNCLRGVNTNGAAVPSFVCSHDLKLSYILTHLGGSGLVRLRNQVTNQCLYALAGVGLPIFNWTCASDPALEFSLDAVSGGYRLRNVSTGKCIYGGSISGDIAHTAPCSSDSSMTYRIDVIHY